MIAIKDMEMPKRCAECKVCILQKINDYGFFGECLLQNRKTVNCLVWSRDSDCPLTKIVTCQNCKHWHNDGIITTCDMNIGYGFPSNHFCADAEKKE